MEMLSEQTAWYMLFVFCTLDVVVPVSHEPAAVQYYSLVVSCQAYGSSYWKNDSLMDAMFITSTVCKIKCWLLVYWAFFR